MAKPKSVISNLIRQSLAVRFATREEICVRDFPPHKEILLVRAADIIVHMVVSTWD